MVECLLYLLSCFVAVRILVPESTRFLGSGISINTLVITVLFFSILLSGRLKISKVDKKLVVIIAIYLLYCFITLFVASTGDFMAQLGNLIEFAITQCLPAIAALLIIKNKKQLELFNNTFVLATIVTCIYGIVTYLLKKNLYVEALTGKVIEMSTWKGYATFATFTSTTTFGYFLALAIPYILYLLYKNEKVKGKIIKLSLFLALICVILCKKRSAMVSIIGMAVLLAYMSPKTKKYFSRIIIVAVTVLLGIVLIKLIPGFEQLDNFITASVFFWNDKAVNVTAGELGSTMELRIRQLVYPFVEINNNILFGHGFGWCGWYIKEHILHPILYGFESIFATSICELGILGLIVYPMFFFQLYKSYLLRTKSIDFGLLFLLTYIIDIVASGMNYFFLFLLLLVMINKEREFEYGKLGNKSSTSNLRSTSI